jgi:hypothetical protein
MKILPRKKELTSTEIKLLVSIVSILHSFQVRSVNERQKQLSKYAEARR